MINQLFILASIALTAVNAHAGAHSFEKRQSTPTSNFQLKETYPAPFVVPTAKPEWLELIKNVTITKAPVYKNNGAGPQPLEQGDPYCDWTFTGCFGDKDLYQCPKGQWALTYDDGPSEFSPALYDYLDKVGVKATFFMVGGQVVKFPDYAKRAYEAGHEIAMHTWSHTYMTTLTNEQIVAELKWNELAIKEATGVSPRYFRPPYGDIDNRVRDVAAALGFYPIIWNHDTNDWAYASAPETFQASWIDSNVTQWVNAAATATVGGVSLEHDLYKTTVDVAIRILPKLKEAYTLVPAGACNKVPLYKESTTPAGATTANTTAPAASAAVPSTLPPANTTADAKADVAAAAAAASPSSSSSSTTTTTTTNNKANANVSTSQASLTATSAFSVGIIAAAAAAVMALL
ncbi:hypothetical protein BDF20DRAFT_835481 [Mycotypha africana]|uniref:uncharacterized protein n=1 Tax=Mycotypha africana TaxID=64632 RepID=UPI002301AE52|nr:uncharacterized protein BDF20DRAFT_835481 [Mycotypha africana]KAI8979466.1 hypothetical protein BDF20DRAFT_835481 [Mycotypha africana]